MSIEQMLKAVESGVCPFTKKPYDCARCDSKKFMTDWLNKGGHTCHFGLDITRPLTLGNKGWRDTLRFFERQDRAEARRVLTQMLKFGVEVIPVGNCDLEHFCFVRGCDGHKVEGEVAR